MKLTLRKPRKILINITSLIDVLFLLLIFFMVSSTFIENPGMDLELPESESSSIQQTKDLVLQMQADDVMFLNNVSVNWTSLRSALESEHLVNPGGALILKADKNVRHGSVVRIMDYAKQIGLVKLIIATSDKNVVQ